QEAVHYINADEESFIEGVGQVLKAGYVITIDYGNSLAELLRAESSVPDLKNFRVYQAGVRQQSYNPYMAVTLQDMTTDQDFTTLATAGQKAGLKVIHFGSQGDLTRGTPLEWGVVGGLMSFDISQLRNYAKWDKAKMINGQHEFFHGANFKMLVQQQTGTDPDYNVFRDLDEPPLITSKPLAADDPRVLFLQQALGVTASSAVGDLLTAGTNLKGINRVLIPLLGRFEMPLFSPSPSDPFFYRNTADRTDLTSRINSAVESRIQQVLKLKNTSRPLGTVPLPLRQKTLLNRTLLDFVSNATDAVLMKLDQMDDPNERAAATKAAKIAFSYREDPKSGQFEAVLSDVGNGVS
ncbi:MAG: SAM-dependent methyltransferase, partial [Candidatus Omnitrophica bacterium]|nr:SAM-dependent methyltransferase [Candidatus Omnitrophota bacterium]